jgi:addiction module HigA family antidote
MANEDEHLPFPPPHPGEVLREDILPALNMTVTELANHLSVKRQTLSPLIHGRRAVSVEMAQCLGKAFGNGARFWLALQIQYEIWHAEQERPVDVAPLNWKAKAAA